MLTILLLHTLEIDAMLDFRRYGRPTNDLQMPLQGKLLGIVVAAGLVMLLVSMTSDSRRWKWILHGQRADQQEQETVLAHDTQPAQRATGGDLPTFDTRPEGLPQQAGHHPESFFPGVQTELLQTVKDNTVFRKAESGAWFSLLAVLRGAEDRELARASVGKVSFRQLYAQPQEYRGRVVTLQGVVRGAAGKESPANAAQIGNYYQLSVEPNDEPGQLIVVYTLELPPGFPLGNPISERATIDGFFFKRWAYAAGDAVRTAPLALARTVIWQPTPAGAPPGSEVSPLLAALLALGLFAIVALLYAATHQRRSPSLALQPKAAKFSADALAAKTGLESGDDVPLPRDGV